MQGPESSIEGERLVTDAKVFSATPQARKPEVGSAAFFWLSAFYVVYCARPEDWIPGLKYIPLAKITGIAAFLGLLLILGKTKRGFRDLPREAMYLLALIALTFPSALLSPVWKGGAMSRSLDFAKVYIAWLLTFLLVTSFARLRRVIFIQAGSVAVISIISVLKGRSHPRLQGFLGGIYSNPNDLAFAIVLSLPFCIAFLLSARGLLRKVAWIASILIMSTALILTASRGGFVTLLVAGMVALWHFGIRGRRLYLIVATIVIGALLLAVSGKVLTHRFAAMSGEKIEGTVQERAYGSFQQREELMILALDAIVHHPIFGLGVHNFANYSGTWREVHMTYLQVGVEVGIPALILYLMFFARGFTNLRKLRKRRDLDPETKLFVGALHSSLVGFVVGACFAPEAYQFFPYFAVAYTSVMVALVAERDAGRETPVPAARRGFAENYARQRGLDAFTAVR
jgi:O-antigen ligase